MQASIEDAYGNVVTSAANTVSVAFANNPTGATLSGTFSVTAIEGVATFSNLTINKTGSGYTLRVSSIGLTSAHEQSHQRDQDRGCPVHAVRSGRRPGNGSSLVPLVLDSPDLWDGLRFKKRSRSV